MKVALLSFLLSFNIFAATKAKVSMPDTINIAGKNLVLNGQGIRKATFFGIKVYVGGLYLESKSSDYSSFSNPKKVKFLRMEFVRNVSAEKIKDGWTQGFNNSHNSQVAEIKKDIDKFNSYMPDMEKGDRIDITFLTDGVEVIVKNKKMPKIVGEKFSKSLLSVWFINAADEGLRDGLLGKKIK